MSDPFQQSDRRDRVKQACTILYDSLPRLDAGRLQSDLEALVGPCRVEWAESNSGLPITAGIAQWGPHRVAMLAMDVPVTEEVLARTVGVSPMPDDLRAAMLAHRASIRLLYVGDDDSPLAQLTALYGVAMALMIRGALGVINERAALGQPAERVLSVLSQLGGDPPPLGLWVGVMTYHREEEGPARQYLMRTYGMVQFGLPELAIYMADRSKADDLYHLLLNVGLYMIEGETQSNIEPGHSITFRGHTYLFTTQGGEYEVFDGPRGLLLVEV